MSRPGLAGAIAWVALAAVAPRVAAGQARADSRTPQRASPLEAPAPPRPDRPRGTGAVAYVTATRAYLDVGLADGLAAGARLAVRRAGAEVGRCAVDLVSEHHASCPATGLRTGDTFRYEAAPEPPAPKLLPALPSDDELERRGAVVAAAPLAKVEYRAPPRARAAALADRRRTVEVALGHASYLSTTAGASHAERLDVSVRDAEVGAGLSLDVDARATRWLRRERPRFRPDDDTQLHVWQAQLTAPAGRALTLAAGRILPWTIAGATVFDGASAALRLGPAEVGLFGGAVPEPDTLAPSAERATGGTFWSVGRAPFSGAVLRHEGRLAVVRSPELGTRVETTLAGRAYLRAVDVSVEAQLGAGGEVRAPGLLDAARVDLAVRPVRGVAAGGSYRHLALDRPQPLEPPAFPGRTRAADAWASWDVAPALRIGLTGGLARDPDAELDRSWAGPELALPRLLGSRGGVTVGYLEERGWLEGRSAYVQLVAQPWRPLRLVARASWFHESSLGLDREDAGLFASAAADLGRGLGLRVSGVARTPLGGDRGGFALGSAVNAALYATY